MSGQGTEVRARLRAPPAQPALVVRAQDGTGCRDGERDDGRAVPGVDPQQPAVRPSPYPDRPVLARAEQPGGREGERGDRAGMAKQQWPLTVAEPRHGAVPEAGVQVLAVRE